MAGTFKAPQGWVAPTDVGIEPEDKYNYDVGSQGFFRVGDRTYDSKTRQQVFFKTVKNKDGKEVDVPYVATGRTFVTEHGVHVPGDDTSDLPAAEHEEAPPAPELPPETPAPSPSPSPSPTRDVPAPDNSGAKGTQTSPTGSSKMLDIPGMADINSFLSTQLPETPGEKPVDLPSTPPVGARITNENGEEFFGPAYGNPADSEVVEGVTADPTNSKKGGTNTETADTERAIEVQSGAQWVDGFGPDVGNDGPDPADYATKSDDPRRTAYRNAFLYGTGNTSQDIMKAANAIGVHSDGHKAWAKDGDTQREISMDSYRKHIDTGLTAEELKGAYVGKIKETLVPSQETDITEKPGESGPNKDTKAEKPDYSATDYGEMGYSQKDADTIADDGAVVTTIDADAMKSGYFTKDQEWEFDQSNTNPGT